MNAARTLLVLGIAAALLLALTGVGAWALWTADHDVVIWIMLIEAPIYAAAAWYLWRQERVIDRATQRRALLVILGVAVIGRTLLVFPPPVSTDIYRYVWDGRVQAAGINPYRYRPADAELEFLRDQSVYPYINRADTAVTIYPPMAQMIYFAVTRVSQRITAMKAAMAGFEALTVGALWSLLRHRGLPETRLIFYAWHPLPLFEFGGSGHIDAAAIALMLLACALADRRRPFIAGALLAGAALVKFFPAIIAPVLYRRWDWRFPAALLAAAVALYLPYLGIGRHVLGFLPTYFQEEQLASGGGFFLLSAMGAFVRLPPWTAAAYIVGGVTILAGLAAAVALRRDRTAVPMASALVLMGLFTVFVSPHLAWYFCWVIPLLCFKPSWALIYLSGAAPLLYAYIWAPDPLMLYAALYVPFMIIFCIEIGIGLHRACAGVSNERRLGSRHAN